MANVIAPPSCELCGAPEAKALENGAVCCWDCRMMLVVTAAYPEASCDCGGKGCPDCVPEMNDVDNVEQFGGGIGGR